MSVIPAGISGAVDHEVNPDYIEVFKLAIHGTGYPLPGEYDELFVYLYIKMCARREAEELTGAEK